MSSKFASLPSCAALCIAMAGGISAAQAADPAAAPVRAQPVLVSATLTCIDINGCETQHLSILGGGLVPFGFTFGLASDGSSTIDISGEFYSAASAAMASGAPVLCGGTQDLANYLADQIIVNRHLLSCQIVYDCVKANGRFTAGGVAVDVIDVHNDAYDKNKLPVHCS